MFQTARHRHGREGDLGKTDESAYTPGSVRPADAAALATVAAIHLGLPSPTGSSGPPAGSGGPPSNACAGHRLAAIALLTLLRVGFTEPSRSPGMLVGSYPTVSPSPAAEPRRSAVIDDGGLFSVALSRGSPRVAVNNHPALWSPDVPRRRLPADAAARPTRPSVIIIPRMTWLAARGISRLACAG